MKFKIGDKVRVREDLVVGNYYGRECFVGKMEYNKCKVFEIKGICEGAYIFEEDGFHWTDEMLEKVKKEKETQEKTFREVITDIKEGEVWENLGAKIIKDSDSIQMLGFSNFMCFMDSSKIFKLQRKEYTFEEAFKAYEEGKEIESCYSQYKYKKEGGLDLYSKTENEWYVEDRFEIDEIRGKWYINN